MRGKAQSGKKSVESGKQVVASAAHPRRTGRKARPAARKSLSRELATRSPQTLPVAVSPQPIARREGLSESKIIEAFDALGITTKLNEQQKKLFIAVAMEFQLNPLRREIHAVRMGGDEEGKEGTLVPMVGYEVYIDRAEETGRLEYWYLEEAGEIAEDWRKSTYLVTLVIKRRDWPKEFRWSVRFVEAAGLKWDSSKRVHILNAMWRKRGHFMTQKCTIGQGFRMCFREVLRGMPYIDAEIENVENGHEPEHEEKGNLRAPQALLPPGDSALADPPAPIQTESEPASESKTPTGGPYEQIMSTLNEKVKSKEGPLVALFGTQEKMEWKAKADMSRGKPEEITATLEELQAAAEARRKHVKGEV